MKILFNYLHHNKIDIMNTIENFKSYINKQENIKNELTEETLLKLFNEFKVDCEERKNDTKLSAPELNKDLCYCRLYNGGFPKQCTFDIVKNNLCKRHNNVLDKDGLLEYGYYNESMPEKDKKGKNIKWNIDMVVVKVSENKKVDKPKKKYRKCGICGQADGHNARTCPNKIKVEKQPEVIDEKEEELDIDTTTEVAKILSKIESDESDLEMSSDEDIKMLIHQGVEYKLCLDNNITNMDNKKVGKWDADEENIMWDKDEYKIEHIQNESYIGSY